MIDDSTAFAINSAVPLDCIKSLGLAALVVMLGKGAAPSVGKVKGRYVERKRWAGPPAMPEQAAPLRLKKLLPGFIGYCHYRFTSRFGRRHNALAGFLFPEQEREWNTSFEGAMKSGSDFNAGYGLSCAELERRPETL
jgi:hypothetical protein